MYLKVGVFQLGIPKLLRISSQRFDSMYVLSNYQSISSVVQNLLTKLFMMSFLFAVGICGDNDLPFLTWIICDFSFPFVFLVTVTMFFFFFLISLVFSRKEFQALGTVFYFSFSSCLLQSSFCFLQFHFFLPFLCS